MNHRIASILSQEAANAAATKTIDINLATPISRITVQFRGTNSTDAPTGHPAKMVSKIEVVDGSDVLFSLSGTEAQALNFFNNGRMPQTALQYIANAMPVATYQIDFGRFLWDDLLALDPKKFMNPQLKITHNLALGGSDPTAATLTVYAHCYDEKAITPQGFLMSKEQYSYTLVNSSREHIDLATDYVYRGLMIKALVGGKQPWELYHDIKLSENNDQKVVINDISTSDLLKLLNTHPPIDEFILCSGLAAEPVYITPAMWAFVTALGLNIADAAIFGTQAYGGMFTGTQTAATAGQFHVIGFNPHGAMMLPFGKQDVIEDWYNVSKIGSLKLTVTGGAAVGVGSVCEIVSQQYRPYAGKA